MTAQGMSAGTAKTPKAVEGEARQPGPKDAPKLHKETRDMTTDTTPTHSMTTDTPSEAGLVERRFRDRLASFPDSAAICLLLTKRGDEVHLSTHTEDLLARITALEAESAALRDMLRETRDAADEVLAPICAAACRYMIERPEMDAIADLHSDGVTIPYGAFQRLYDATDPDRIAQAIRGKA